MAIFFLVTDALNKSVTMTAISKPGLIFVVKGSTQYHKICFKDN